MQFEIKRILFVLFVLFFKLNIIRIFVRLARKIFRLFYNLVSTLKWKLHFFNFPGKASN